MKKGKLVKSVIASAALVSLLGLGAGCESIDRGIKDIKSENGGLQRTVKIMNIEGDVVKEYKGKFDVTVNEHRVKFLKDGKSILIYRSSTDTVLIEES